MNEQDIFYSIFIQMRDNLTLETLELIEQDIRLRKEKLK